MREYLIKWCNKIFLILRLSLIITYIDKRIPNHFCWIKSTSITNFTKLSNAVNNIRYNNGIQKQGYNIVMDNYTQAYTYRHAYNYTHVYVPGMGDNKNFISRYIIIKATCTKIVKMSWKYLMIWTFLSKESSNSHGIY